MQGFNIALQLKTAAEARRIFTAFSEGGHVVTPLGDVAGRQRLALSLTDLVRLG